MQKKHQSSTIRFLNLLFPIFFVMVLIIVGIPVATYHYFARDLVSTERIMNRNEAGLTLLDKEGEEFFAFYDAKPKHDVLISDIPQHTQDAVIASEDKHFYRHTGYSIPGIVRSFFANMKEQEITQGGSTITQQLVKNALLTPKKSYLRKYQEVVLAQEIERRYTKAQILEMYLNSAYFGQGAFGIQQAAETYFNKDASELSLAESALIVGLLPAPSAFSPVTGDQEQAIMRQHLVLQQMEELGYITPAQYTEALNTELSFNTKEDDINSIAPHFALLIRNRLIEQYGEENLIRQGFIVTTTLDREIQQVAEAAAADQVQALSSQNASNASVVVIDPATREVRAMVGSVNWADDTFGKVNVAVRPRQPGSSFKPLVYAKALDDGIITPATILQDRQTTFATDYTPQNYDRRFRGNVTVRRALANSLNVPAVHVMTQVGVEEIVSYVTDFGITSLREPVHYGPSLVLGTGEVTLLELTNAYATFAANGLYDDPVLITHIEDKFGKTTYTHTSEPHQVLSPAVTFLISSILSDNVARSETFGDALTISRPAAVKTGTTDNYKDAWTLGYTPQVVVGVWVGNNDNKPMNVIAGSLGAAPIWRKMMEYTLQNEPVVPFTPPDGVESVRVCANGLRIPPQAPAGFGYTEYFLTGTAPTSFCQYHPPQEDDEAPESKSDDNDTAEEA